MRIPPNKGPLSPHAFPPSSEPTPAKPIGTKTQKIAEKHLNPDKKDAPI